MATIRCELTITDSNGNAVETRPSTSKVFAKQYASRAAKAIGGTYEIRDVQPREYNGGEW